MKIVEVRQGQTLADIAIKEYGCYEGIGFLLQDNSSLSVDVDLVPGTLINVQETVPELTTNNITVANVFKTQQINPNSGYYPEIIEGDFLEEDFKSIDYLV
ncbi:MAG: hypothetical protein ACEQSR_01305 [Candidatus Methylacidiphilales bacterium]